MTSKEILAEIYQGVRESEDAGGTLLWIMETEKARGLGEDPAPSFVVAHRAEQGGAEPMISPWPGRDREGELEQILASLTPEQRELLRKPIRPGLFSTIEISGEGDQLYAVGGLRPATAAEVSVVLAPGEVFNGEKATGAEPGSAADRLNSGLPAPGGFAAVCDFGVYLCEPTREEAEKALKQLEKDSEDWSDGGEAIRIVPVTAAACPLAKLLEEEQGIFQFEPKSHEKPRFRFYLNDAGELDLHPEQPKAKLPSLDALASQIIAWQAKTFPMVTLSAAFIHFYREVEELSEAPFPGEEMADVFFLLLQCATKAGVNLTEEVAKKFEKNLKRTWKAPDADGVVEHEE